MGLSLSDRFKTSLEGYTESIMSAQFVIFVLEIRTSMSATCILFVPLSPLGLLVAIMPFPGFSIPLRATEAVVALEVDGIGGEMSKKVV